MIESLHWQMCYAKAGLDQDYWGQTVPLGSLPWGWCWLLRSQGVYVQKTAWGVYGRQDSELTPSESPPLYNSLSLSRSEICDLLLANGKTDEISVLRIASHKTAARDSPPGFGEANCHVVRGPVGGHQAGNCGGPLHHSIFANHLSGPIWKDLSQDLCATQVQEAPYPHSLPNIAIGKVKHWKLGVLLPSFLQPSFLVYTWDRGPQELYSLPLSLWQSLPIPRARWVSIP